MENTEEKKDKCFIAQYRKDERQQGADRLWWGEEVSKPDNTSPLAG